MYLTFNVRRVRLWIKRENLGTSDERVPLAGRLRYVRPDEDVVVGDWSTEIDTFVDTICL